jgi:hypothetical protein
MDIEQPKSVKLKIRERKTRSGVGKGLKAKRRKTKGVYQGLALSIRIKQWQK